MVSCSCIGKRLQRLREVVDHDVGQIAMTQFSFMGDAQFERTNIRAHGKLYSRGSGDLGWYLLALHPGP